MSKDNTKASPTLQLAESNKGAGEGDSANEGAQKQRGFDDIGGRVGGKVRILKQEVGETGKDGGSTD